MKKLYFVIFIILFQYNAVSQVWIDSGAVWHYDYWGIAEGGFLKYVYSGDSLIEGRNCQVIKGTFYRFVYTQHDSLVLLGQYALNDEFTYVSGDTVFYRNNGRFFILYNFGASIGDEWVVSYVNDGFGECDDTSRIVVTDTGTMTVNHFNYRSITVRPASNSSIGFEGRYVERFGNIDQQFSPFQYLFPGAVECDSITGVVEWYYFKFKCFEDRSFTLYDPSSEDCEYYLTHLGIDEKIQGEFLCYPNPASDILTIEHDFPGISSVQIYSHQGILLRSFKMNENSKKIDISDLNSGIYFLNFQSENDGHFTRKIIKI